MPTLETWILNLLPNRSIIFWVFAANYVLALIFVVSEIFRSRTSQGSIAWIITLLVLPFPMTLIYAIFGIKTFDDYAAVQTHSGRVLRRVRASKTKNHNQQNNHEAFEEGQLRDVGEDW